MKLIKLMRLMESAGIPTRFPHNSHQYHFFASKEWTAQLCLTPGLHVPLTTKLSRQLIEHRGVEVAAKVALSALHDLKRARRTMFSEGSRDIVLEIADSADEDDVKAGVVKLGWSWEAADVIKWTNFFQLKKGIAEVMEQPDNYMDFCYVQEFIDNDVEMRFYVIKPTGDGPPPIAKIVYTRFTRLAQGHFTDFDRFGREQCVEKYFSGDSEALEDAENQTRTLIVRWLQWMRAESAELPVFIRFDVFAKRLEPGKASVMVGELTELGGCFLGWPEGPKVVFAAMIESFFGSNRGVWNKDQKKKDEEIEDVPTDCE